MTGIARAPARTVSVRAGAVLLFLLGTAACDEAAPGRGPPVLELAEDTIRLGGGVTLHEVTLGGRGRGGGVAPQRIEARAGDVLRFVASDALGYSIRFVTTGMSPENAEFLETSGQVASPPLLGQGAAWVINLEGAPPGEYPFASVNHDAGGVLVVR